MILFFSDLHINETAQFSVATETGFTVRQMEAIQCCQDIVDILQDPQYDIEAVVFGGDMINKVGNNISTSDLACMTKCIIMIQQECIKRGITFYIIPGNHDIASNTQGFHKLIPFKSYQNVEIVDIFKEVGDYVFMPYAYDDEEANNFLEGIQDKENKIVFSHLEIKGIPLGNGIETTHGVSLSLLKQFKMVLQGHYHSGGNFGKNIQIAGSTQRLSFKDPGLARNNILIYDTEKNTIERKSFDCPDWLTFTDNNIDEVLSVSNNNYVKLDISTDILLTPEIKEKLTHMKGTDIHIDIKRLSINRDITEEIQPENEIDVITQFVNKSDNTDEQKRDLINEGRRLLDRVKNA